VSPAPHLSFGMEPSGFTTTISTTNGLNVDLTDVSAVTFWVDRAGAREGRYVLTVTSNGPAKITLAGTFGTRVVTVPAGTTTRTVTL
jgi:hypothetical protein